MIQTSRPIPHFCFNCIFFGLFCLPQWFVSRESTIHWPVALTLVKKGRDGKYASGYSNNRSG